MNSNQKTFYTIIIRETYTQLAESLIFLAALGHSQYRPVHTDLNLRTGQVKKLFLLVEMLNLFLKLLQVLSIQITIARILLFLTNPSDFFYFPKTVQITESSLKKLR